MGSFDKLLVAKRLAIAQFHAGRGEFAEMRAACIAHVREAEGQIAPLLEAGSILMSAGFLSDARGMFNRASELSPGDLRPLVNLANISREEGDHSSCTAAYRRLLQLLPDHPVVRRNFLVSLEYDPKVEDTTRVAMAQDWGAWARRRAGGGRERPNQRRRAGEKLRLGYVSADFCQHTVGLFVKDIIAHHDRGSFEIYCYSAGEQRDWVTSALMESTTFREVGKLHDHALASVIAADGIDILIDLSGHTAGSRLSVFAYRPARVQLSWLGYFATTGLRDIDAVLVDEWHAPPGMERQFVEPIVRLRRGRFCYQPVPWAPPPRTAGIPDHQPVTFGSFNNTAKLNDGVFDAWATILTEVPNSRLVLKWRTFNDPQFCDRVKGAFSNRGVVPERIELRGPSFHRDLLHEYSDIDIGLDPFPFSGGLTTCEALWMGVPVITCPQSRLVSRQTSALLHQAGLVEFCAATLHDYVSLACGLARDREHLATIRATLRPRMLASSLMDVGGYCRAFEETLKILYEKTY